MLQYRSFKISDDEGMNNLLKKYLLAGGVSVLVSEGQVTIPYNDGQEFNKEQKLSLLMGSKEEVIQKFENINFNHRVLEKQVAGATTQLKEKEEKLKIAKDNKKAKNNKETYIDEKTLENDIKRLKNVVDQLTTSLTNTRAELTRMDLEIEVYDELISEVE